MLVRYIKDIGDEDSLNIGQIYVVLSISIGIDGSTHYVIKRSLKHCCFGFFLADCFEIVSHKIPDYWIFAKSDDGIELLPEEWYFDEFWLQYSDYEPEVYNMAEGYVMKMILSELPIDEFNRALKLQPYEKWQYIDELEYILEMITEARDDRFIKHVLEVAKWFRLYTFNQVNKYTYKQEVEVLEKVYIYLSLFKNNYEIKELFEDFINKNDTKFPKVLEIISEYFQ